jgi:hypothetical protein
VEEIMVPGSIEPVGKDEPWVFADESLLEAISRLNSLSSEVSAVSRKSSVQVVDRSGRRVGELTYQRLIRVIGEALPLASRSHSVMDYIFDNPGNMLILIKEHIQLTIAATMLAVFVGSPLAF